MRQTNHPSETIESEETLHTLLHLRRKATRKPHKHSTHRKNASSTNHHQRWYKYLLDDCPSLGEIQVSLSLVKGSVVVLGKVRLLSLVWGTVRLRFAPPLLPHCVCSRALLLWIAPVCLFGDIHLVSLAAHQHALRHHAFSCRSLGILGFSGLILMIRVILKHIAIDWFFVTFCLIFAFLKYTSELFYTGWRGQLCLGNLGIFLGHCCAILVNTEGEKCTLKFLCEEMLSPNISLRRNDTP